MQSRIEKGGQWIWEGRFKITSTFRLLADHPIVKNLLSLLSVKSKVILFSQLSLLKTHRDFLHLRLTETFFKYYLLKQVDLTYVDLLANFSNKR